MRSPFCSIHESMNTPKIEFVAYIYLHFISNIKVYIIQEKIVLYLICNCITFLFECKTEKLNSQRKHGQPM